MGTWRGCVERRGDDGAAVGRRHGCCRGRRCAAALPEVAARASRGGLDVPVVRGLDVYPILTCVHFILSSHIIF